MRHITLIAAITFTALIAVDAQTPAGPRAGIDWPGFRGINATGVDEKNAPPVQWSVPDATLVKWKTPVSGLGHSSPVVWGDQVCTASAISGTPDPQLKVGLYGDIESVKDLTEHKWIVACYDKNTGKQRWERVAKSGVPIVKRHPKSTHASSTLATDGRHIVAMFGSEGLYAYSMSGELIWKKDFGTLDSGFYLAPDAQWGFASSPVIHNGRVIIQADVQKGSFVAAFDVRSGRELWRTPRADVPTFSTPAIVSMNGRDQVIVNGWKHIGGYDFATGREVWRMTGGGDIPVPTPIVADDLIFITNAHGSMAPIYAIRPGMRGDITPDAAGRSPHVAWMQAREGAYMQTPLVYGGLLYNCRDNGVLSVYDARTGTRHYQQRLAEGRTGFTASPVAADGQVYFTSEDGDVHVVKAGPSFELLASNSMGEVCMATPAVSEGRLYFRTRGHLMAIGPS